MSKPIPVSQGTAMIKTYNSYMQSLGVDMKDQTQCVSFNLTELMAWLNKMTAIADEIRVFMGDYPDGAQDAGRTTVILWPYKDGKPARTTDKSLATETDPELPPCYDGDDCSDPEDPCDPENPGDPEDPCDPGDPGDGAGDPADPFNEGNMHP